MDNRFEDIETLRANRKKSKLTREEREALRKDVKKILERSAEKERKMRRAEMERLYELGLYA